MGLFFCLFFWFDFILYVPAKSYGHVGMVSSHNHTVFPGQAFNQYFVHIISLVTDNNPFESVEWRRTTVEIISWSISKKVWDRAGIELYIVGTQKKEILIFLL